MEYEEFRGIRNDTDLFEYLRDKFQEGVDNYLFIDEVQDIDGFEHVLRNLQARDNCDIYITGSNAKMLSGELSTYLSGRYVEFHVHSLNYPEFLEFHQLEDNNRSLMLYLTYGGLPYLSRLQLTDELAFEYLRNIISRIQSQCLKKVYITDSLTLHYIFQQYGRINIPKVLKCQFIRQLQT